MKKTYVPSHKEIVRDWHLIDADSKVLGKVAADVSKLLIGKNKATFTNNINVGDKVVIINAEKVAYTGGSKAKKVYHRITGYPGGVRSETLEKMLVRKPTEVLRKAVLGMLPKNKLRKDRMKNLYIYQGPEHPHQAQLTK